jgi:Cu/Ag efflux pump CusA
MRRLSKLCWDLAGNSPRFFSPQSVTYNIHIFANFLSVILLPIFAKELHAEEANPMQYYWLEKLTSDKLSAFFEIQIGDYIKFHVVQYMKLIYYA